MTIRMLQAWNGYPKDQIVDTLSAPEEARLISIGFASADLDGTQLYEYLAKLKKDENGNLLGFIDPNTGIIIPLGGSSTEPELAITASRDALLTDVGNILTSNQTSAVVITIPSTATFNPPNGTILTAFQANTGAVSFAPGAGVPAFEGTAPTSAENAHISIRKRTGNTWVWVTGDGAGSQSALPALKVTRKAINQLKVGEINKVNVVFWGDRLLTNGDITTFANDPIERAGFNRAKFGFANLLASELSKVSGMLVNNNFYCTPFEPGNSVAHIAKHDSRNVLTGTWTRGDGNFRVIGGVPSRTAVTGSKQTFTPYNVFGSDISDTVDLYYRVDATYGSVAVSVDGGTTTLATRNLASTAFGANGAAVKWTVPLPRGANVLTLTADCTGSKIVPEMIIHLTDSETPSIELIPLAWTIATTMSFFNNFIRNQITLLNPHLVICAGNISLYPDATPTQAAQYCTDFYDGVKSYADAAYLILPPVQTLDPNPTVKATVIAGQRTYKDIVLAAAASQGALVVDIWKQWGDGNWDAYAADGYYTDAVSYSHIGNQDIATGLKALFEEIL